MQTDLNGAWQEISGLNSIDASTAGHTVPIAASYDVFLPRDQTLNLHVDAASIGCLDTLFGHSLLEDLIRFGFNPANPATFNGAVLLGTECLNAGELGAGSIEASFGAPTFGVSDSTYQVTSSNGAFTLRFRVDRFDD